MSIELQDISLIYNKGTTLERVVLDKVSMTIAQGKFAALIGNNGAGKSTLAKVIAGEVIVNEGKVIIGNQDCTNIRDFDRAKFISRVFQDPGKGTARNLTVLENLIFASRRDLKRTLVLSLKKDPRAFFKKKLQELNAGLEDKLDEPVFMLSGGQKQILSLLMAVLRPSKILLLDEHTAALDPEAAKLVMRFTHHLLRNHNMTTIMITHDMSELDYCDEVYAITNCKIKKMHKNF